MRRIIVVLILTAINFVYPQTDFVKVKPKHGDGIYSLLRKYKIKPTPESIQIFKNLNREKLKSNNLFTHVEYYLPIKIYEYNGISIRSTINNEDYEYAKSIQDYNLALFVEKLKPADYRVDNVLWVPDLSFNTEKTAEIRSDVYQIFGKDYQDVEITGNELEGHIYYLVSGHGGPDPGAISQKNGRELHEDEYAYDVTLRLARKLIQHSATVYIIVRDPDDGIRDGIYLDNDYHEVYLGNSEISPRQKTRLQQRVEIINELYAKEKNSAESQHVIVIHVDSRYTGKQIDIFFYHNPNSGTGKNSAETLLKTIEEKYHKAQPGRGYKGTVSDRNLYMLRNTHPPCVYIELGNIKNPRDQLRIVEPNNRQAIANWLTDGLIIIANTK